MTLSKEHVGISTILVNFETISKYKVKNTGFKLEPMVDVENRINKHTVFALANCTDL